MSLPELPEGWTWSVTKVSDAESIRLAIVEHDLVGTAPLNYWVHHTAFQRYIDIHMISESDIPATVESAACDLWESIARDRAINKIIEENWPVQWQS